MQEESGQFAVSRAFSGHLFLDLVLCHDRHAANSKSQRNNCNTEHFEGYPVIGTQGAPGNLIGQCGGQEHGHPQPAQRPPASIMHAKLRPHNCTKGVAAQKTSAGDHRRQQDSQHRWLDLDEQLIVKIKRQATKKADRDAAKQRHHRDAALQYPAGGQCHNCRGNQHTDGQHKFTSEIVCYEKDDKRAHIQQQFAALPLRRLH